MSAKFSKGFTIIELLVSIGIMTVILTVIFLHQSKYTDQTRLYNLADEFSLNLREAQVYGVAVKELTPGSADFLIAYGLTFSILDSGSTTSYIIFADRNADGIYNGDWTCPMGGTSECLRRVDLPTGYYIDSVCVPKLQGFDICNTRRIDVTFLRPNTEARFIFFNAGGQTYLPGSSAGARITFKSPSGLTRNTAVYYSGQISVQ